ncbi:hypothetical protein Rhsp01_36180 [Rhizobium sp. NBRC 114257]|uniref:Uncharacterized protein n=1 Tax=Rhizobium dioscoreae TaxID=2653122 RepID=A0ABQ0Z6R1_9HYPH|nr:hypothetical protein [Rhizobium sp. NBRC 114257]GES50992.1 hypothetical protein RsS93_36060 [Rhizobium dioscoreae]GLU82442.1 hypothetical protein Rhsp01_36180 [Rhizobium sp. NBRC 114257]
MAARLSCGAAAAIKHIGLSYRKSVPIVTIVHSIEGQSHEGKRRIYDRPASKQRLGHVAAALGLVK